ncbi:hypothetical protein AALO_G00181050 [Alosa alosa]|uniref:Kinesin-like protein KIF13A n=1 Tax=Alosa alosa TaxID=278164 RepID=A0AAV6GCE4_9TELE|nr:hypothetical protein AALO_G00181050 [Alosa alosa]
MKMSDSKVKVAVRVRPMNRREIELSTKCVVDMEENQTILHPPPSNSKGDSSVACALGERRALGPNVMGRDLGRGESLPSTALLLSPDEKLLCTQAPAAKFMEDKKGRDVEEETGCRDLR